MSNRSDCVIIQQASGAYKDLLKLGLDRHLAYAERHGMDYWPIFGETRAEDCDRHAYWEKANLISTALEAGYDVIWLDSDALITGDDDLRKAFPENAISAVWHAMQWGSDLLYDHFNAGVLYIKNTEDVRVFVRRWWCSDDKGHPWHDQHALNQLAKSQPGRVQEISRYWHSTYPYHMHESRPMVIAWHGYGDIAQRKAAMQAFLLNEEQPNLVPAAQNTDLFALAQEYENKGEWGKAATVYHTLLRTDRDEPLVLQRYASVCLGMGEYGQAERLLRESLAFDCRNADAWRQLGGVLSHMGREAESVPCLRESLRLEPDSPMTQWNMALAELRAGKIVEGLSRWKWGYVSGGRKLRTQACPEWNGKPLFGGTLFVWAEQGFGDTLMFCRFLSDARRQSGAAEVICEVQPQLIALLSDCEGVRFVKQTPDFSLPCTPDAHISLMELPRVLTNFSLETVGESVPYLFHDEEVRPSDDIRQKLTEPGLNVGLCWAGSKTHHNDRLRSLTMEELLCALIDTGANLTSIQQGQDTFGGLHDWTDTAAVIEHLGLIITCDTGVAHLAGAMGKPVWILLAVGADWRWGLEGEASVWYPSARLFRQTRFADWSDVLEHVACELAILAAQQKPLLRVEGEAPLLEGSDYE